MPDRVIDAHVHFWDLSNPWYPALKEMADNISQPELYTDFDITDYRRAAGDLKIDALVHVSATTAPGAYLDELRWIADSAVEIGMPVRFIGTVDPTLGPAEIVAHLDEQLATPGFAGVRVLYAFPPDSRAAQTVLQWLAEHRLVFELVAQPPAMAAWVSTLAKFPELTTVLEHTGWPTGVDSAAQTEWRDAVRLCAQSTTARCKLSGLGMTTLDLSPSALRPWLDGAIDAFGWDRVLFGSNMPIERMAGSFEQLLASVADVVGDASAAEQDKFYYANAFHTYGFEVTS